MEEETNILINLLTDPDYTAELKTSFNSSPVISKSCKNSEYERENGVRLFGKNKTKHSAENHMEIYVAFSNSIALAPSSSEKLCAAYGNRSQFFFHMHNYQDCIKDIDRAINIEAVSDFLKAKLLCRKVECLLNIDSTQCASVLDLAKSAVDSVSNDHRYKQQLLEKIDVVKKLIVRSQMKPVQNPIQQKPSNEITVKENWWDNISIKQSEKDGRYIVATKDVKPGDVIFTQKLFAASMTGIEESPNIMEYHPCDYCSVQEFASIPCDHCEWSTYCSVICKQSAWKEFHHIECLTIAYMKATSFGFAWKMCIMMIRVIIKAVKEAKSISNLKRHLKAVDESTNETLKGFISCGESFVDRFCSLYTLYSGCSSEELEMIACGIPIILLGLTNTELGSGFHVKNITDLKSNSDLLFLGALMMRICAIHKKHGFMIQYSASESKGVKYMNCHRSGMASLVGLLNHSCSPNAAWISIAANKGMLFALKNIKKDSQIFISYGNTFYEQEINPRQSFYLEKYKFKCLCQACLENWVKVSHSDDAASGERSKRRSELIKKGKNLIKQSLMNLSFIEEVSAEIQNGLEKGDILSESFCDLQIHLQSVFAHLWAPKALLFSGC